MPCSFSDLSSSIMASGCMMILPVSQAVIAADVGFGFDPQGEGLWCL
jgi:hypothetical protein